MQVWKNVYWKKKLKLNEKVQPKTVSNGITRSDQNKYLLLI